MNVIVATQNSDRAEGRPDRVVVDIFLLRSRYGKRQIIPWQWSHITDPIRRRGPVIIGSAAIPSARRRRVGRADGQSIRHNTVSRQGS